MKAVGIKILNKSGFPNPQYANPGDAGMDLKAFIDGSKLPSKGTVGYPADSELKKIAIHPGARVIVPTNLFIGLPEGYEAQIRPRSGMSFKVGLHIANAPGTIDAQYTGNVGIIVANPTDRIIVIEHGDRIAQMVIKEFTQAIWDDVDELGDTVRGTTGFGDSGVK